MNPVTMSDISIGGKTLSLRDVQHTDSGDVIAMHRGVFGSTAAASWYDWKYRDGGGHAIGMWDQNQLVAHCGGIPRLLWCRGESVRGLQIGDVMVAPEWRGLMIRKGPFYHVCKAFYGAKLGASRPFQLGFGFPNDRHFKLGFKSGFGDGGVAYQLHWGSEIVQERLQERLLWILKPEASDAPGFAGKIDNAWRKMRNECTRTGTVTGDRSFPHVQWRYVQRPDKQYTFLGLYRRWSVKPVGIGVVAVPEDRASNWHWVDWIGSTQDMPLACTSLRRWALLGGATGLSAWASSRVAQVLVGTGITSQTVASSIGIPNTSCVEGHWLDMKNWWLMSGDTDFL